MCFFNSINTKEVNGISIVNISTLISGETVSKVLHNFYMHSYSHLCILPHVFKQQIVIWNWIALFQSINMSQPVIYRFTLVNTTCTNPFLPLRSFKYLHFSLPVKKRNAVSIHNDTSEGRRFNTLYIRQQKKPNQSKIRSLNKFRWVHVCFSQIHVVIGISLS